ncbi:DMT family transporter [Methanofollis fontis]|uniref:DMT family transporter n=1 Tax=Methanofollis fontis TaxID=2052832 RepID=UPI00102F010D|nr:DMT family transporter [Methanofollis fontis]
MVFFPFFPHLDSRCAVPVAFALIAALFFGAGTPLSKVLLDSIGPITLGALLYLGAGLLGFILSLPGRERNAIEAPIRRSDVPWLLLSALVGSALSTIILLMSLEHVPAATASLLLSFEAVVTTLLAASVFGEPIGRRVWGAIALITAACLLLTVRPEDGLGLSMGAFGVLIACIFWGSEACFNRQIDAGDPVRLTAVKCTVAGAAMILIALVAGEGAPAPSIALAALALGMVMYGVPNLLYFRALRGLGAARTGSVFGMNPVFGVLFSLLIFHGVPEPIFGVALLLMLVGLGLLLTERHTHLHHHPGGEHEHRHCHDDLHHDHGHPPGTPPTDRSGYHSHTHLHAQVSHDHPHMPDIHHRHRH